MSATFQLPGYSIFPGDLRAHFPAWLRERGDSQLFLLCDANTRRDCLPVFLEKTGLPADLPLAEIPAGESHKTLATCEKVWAAMLAAGLGREALVVCLGGGVVGDLGGFCAATFKRGVDFVQIPTSLLAMTDAAIGGKLGIDFQGIKNAVGVFRDPMAVFADPVFLKTLPGRELRSGLAEIIKHALLGDPDLWKKIQNLPAPDAIDWPEILPASIAVKVRIVREDPIERGLRALLNFGHTVGHALESYFLHTDASLTHGEAVAIGLVCESRLAYGDGPRTAEIAALIARFFPHRPIPETAFPALWSLMQQDKKNASGAVRMAVPEAGKTFALRILEPSREMVENSLRFQNQVS